MARTTGIDAGEFAVKVVELDGSYRKTRLVRHRIERVEGVQGLEAGELRADLTAEAVRDALKGAQISSDVMSLGFPCREAVLRAIQVPFSGRDAIRKVIKSEVEGSIHSHSVDDMVVDFHVIGEDEAGTKVMVAAVPKAELRVDLAALERVGLEPDVVDLDTMALFRAAHWSGAFGEIAAEALEDDEDEVLALEDDEPEEVDEEEPPPQLPTLHSQDSSVRVVVDLGARATRVLIAVNGHLTEMRTLRVGDASIAEAVGRTYGLTPDQAQAAVRHCLTTGQDYEVEILGPETRQVEALPEAAGAEELGGEEAQRPAEVEAVTVPASTVTVARDELVNRLRRELVRFLTSVAHVGSIEMVWVTGGGSQLPGVRPMLEEVFGCPSRELDPLARLSHGLTEEEAQELRPQLAVAIGLALGRLGGPSGFNFRQEDLAYTRGFDRIKFPLAIACMVGLFLVVVYGVKSLHELRGLEMEQAKIYEGDPSRAERGFYEFYGHVGVLLNRRGHAGWFSQGEYFGRDDYKALLKEVAEAPVFERLEIVRDRLRKALVERQEDSGIYEDLDLESGLAVLARFAEMMEATEEKLGRYLLVDLDLKMGVRNRRLDFTVAFRGSDFRQKQGVLRAAIIAECQRADSPFMEYDEGSYREHLFKDSEETGVQGAYFDMSILIKDEFDPFPVTPAMAGGSR